MFFFNLSEITHFVKARYHIIVKAGYHIIVKSRYHIIANVIDTYFSYSKIYASHKRFKFFVNCHESSSSIFAKNLNKIFV